MKKFLFALTAVCFLNGAVWAGRGHHQPNPYSKDFHRQVVHQEIRRAMRTTNDARHSHTDEDASSTVTSFYENTWSAAANSAPDVDAGEYFAKPVGALLSDTPNKNQKVEVQTPAANAEPEEEPGFFSKIGSTVTGFFKLGWGYIKSHKATLGGAAAGAIIGGLVGGPIGALLGALIGGFGGWWVGEGLS